MLKMPKVGGQETLRLFLADIPRSRWLEILGVNQRTLRRWLAPGGKPPAMALQALFWHTRWGDSQIESEYGFAASAWRGLAESLQPAALLRHTHTPAANAPAWRAARLQLVSRDRRQPATLQA